jgi:hypothetical protein
LIIILAIIAIIAYIIAVEVVKGKYRWKTSCMS